ncbi:hypothetical protein INT47_011745 [Mucor saturninus]|uniref:Uncharacterized protein n=1 Tax=Mucor saturninus TaxID=64648 RepID=A0A8H7R3D0_9FUNG|nr:hypothetical protein INT47_011745 [Mucor saturninus]
MARSTAGLSPLSVQSSSAQRVSTFGVFILPPKQPVVPKGKKKDRRLTKIVNSRNPNKFIDSRPIILLVHDRPPTAEERMTKKTKLGKQ